MSRKTVRLFLSLAKRDRPLAKNLSRDLHRAFRLHLQLTIAVRVWVFLLEDVDRQDHGYVSVDVNHHDVEACV